MTRLITAIFLSAALCAALESAARSQDVDPHVLPEPDSELQPGVPEAGSVGEESGEDTVVPATEPEGPLAKCHDDKMTILRLMRKWEEESKSLGRELESAQTASEDFEVMMRNQESNNIILNDELRTCREAFDNTGLLKEKIEDLEAENARLSARIEELGASIVPGFSYFGGTPASSFATSDKALEVSASERLEAGRCEAALVWMEGGAGDHGSYISQTWVWEGTELPKLCRRDAGNAEIIGSTPSTSAHIILYR